MAGQDALTADVSPAEFAAMLGDHATPIKTWLLDQTHLAGIGNIYAAEILFRARISPLRPAKSLDAKESRLLLRLIGEVLEEAVAAFLRAYGRAGEPCRRRGCGGTIVRIVQTQRSTFYCPECQK